MDRFLPLIYLISWFAAIFMASYLINWLLIRSIIRRWYRFFVAPGVIVHELSHAVGCLITGSQITEINFWKASGGHVRHLQSPDPMKRVIADPIIALAPIWGTFLVLAFVTWLILPEIITNLKTGDYYALTNAIDWSTWQPWLYLYLTTSLMATIAPSKTDMRYALASLVVITIILFLAVLLPGVSGWLISLEQQILPFAFFTLVLMAIGLLISFILALPNRNKQFVAREQIE